MGLKHHPRGDLEWSDEARRDEALLKLLVRVHSTPWPADAEMDLTPLELRCVVAASHGLGNIETADLYGYKYETVKTQMAIALRKLGAKNRTHAVAKALRRGLIQ